MHFSFGKINREIWKVISTANACPVVSEQRVSASGTGVELISADAVSGAEALLHYANELSESSLQEEVEFDLPSGGLVKMQRYLMIQQIVVQSTYQRALAGMIS